MPRSQKNSFDFTTGLLMNYKNFYGGVAVKHFTQTDIGVYGVQKLPALINVHASWNKHLGQKTLLELFALYTHQDFYDAVQVNGNAILMNHILVGAGYRTDNTYM